MTDQWKGKVVTINGSPVAIVEVTITRTLMIDAEIFDNAAAVLENRTGDFEPSGLTAVSDFYNAVRDIDEKSRQYISVPWTNADSSRIGLQPFAYIMSLFEKRAYWRLEGSAEKGFQGIFNFGGIDKKVELNAKTIPSFRDVIIQIDKNADEAFQKGEITRIERDAIAKLCSDVKGTLVGCESLLRALAEQRAAKDKAEQDRIQRDRIDREIEQLNEGNYVGDFPDGFGDSYGQV